MNNILPTDPLATRYPNLASIINQVLPLVLVAAGLVLLVMLVMGGLTLMTSGGDPKKTAEGYGKLSSSLIGFVIIFVSYFIVQIVEVMFGIKIF